MWTIRTRKHITKYFIAVIMLTLLMFFFTSTIFVNDYTRASWFKKVVLSRIWTGKTMLRLRNNTGSMSFGLNINCTSLSHHNSKEIARARSILQQQVWVEYSDEFFMKTLDNCKGFLHEFGYITKLDHTQSDYSVAFIILVNTNIEQVERLLHLIYAPQNVYCLHIDKTAPESFHMAIQYLTSCFHNVFVSSQLEQLIPSTFSFVRAQLNCMTDLINYKYTWNYVIKLTSKDFPLVSNNKLIEHLQQLHEHNFVPAYKVVLGAKDQFGHLLYKHKLEARGGKLVFARTNYHKTMPPENVLIYYSEQPYYIATRDFVFHILTDQRAKDIQRWFEDIEEPDLYVWATLNHAPGSPGGGINKHPDFPKIISMKLAPVLDPTGSQPNCEGYYEHGFCTFAVGDLQWLLNQNSLFAGNFVLKHDHLVVQCIQENIRFKENRFS